MNSQSDKGQLAIAHIALFTVAVIYGANYSISKIAMDSGLITPMGIVWLRILTGALVFTPLYFIFVREKIYKKDIWLFVICSLTGVSINMSFFFVGLHYTNPINASLVMTTSPVIVLIFSYLIIQEKIRPVNILGIFIALIGAVLLIYKPEQSFSLDSIKGDLMIFLNATVYSLYLVLVKKLVGKYNPLTILAIVFSLGLVFVSPIGVIEVLKTEWKMFDMPIYLALAFVLLCTTCMAYLFNAFALRTVRSSTAGTYIYLQPLLATIFAILLQKDTLNLKMMLCAVLIFTGLYLVSKKK